MAIYTTRPQPVAGNNSAVYARRIQPGRQAVGSGKHPYRGALTLFVSGEQLARIEPQVEGVGIDRRDVKAEKDMRRIFLVNGVPRERALTAIEILLMQRRTLEGDGLTFSSWVIDCVARGGPPGFPKFFNPESITQGLTVRPDWIPESHPAFFFDPKQVEKIGGDAWLWELLPERWSLVQGIILRKRV